MSFPLHDELLEYSLSSRESLHADAEVDHTKSPPIEQVRMQSPPMAADSFERCSDDLQSPPEVV